MKLKPTKEGKRFILAAFLIAAAAFNTGNNLIYLILAMMLSMTAAAVIAPAVNLKGIRLRIHSAGPVFAKQSSLLRVAVKNGKRFLPSYSLRVTNPNLRGTGRFAFIPSSGSISEDMGAIFEKRGLYGAGDFHMESFFPFIFFKAMRKIPLEGGLTVYPEVKDMEGLYGLSGRDMGSFTMKPGRGDELLMIREFRYGDDLKRISWKASAKTGRVMVREYSKERSGRITVVLDDSGPSNEALFEKAVSFAASVAKKLIEEGMTVRLVSSRYSLPYGGGPEHLYRILDLLAVIEETDALDIPEIEEEGNILILKSGESSFKGLIPYSDMVADASTL